MLIHLKSASAEESSILKDAEVDTLFLKNWRDQWPGTDLIGNSFKDFVAHIDWNPWGDNSAEFSIKLTKSTKVKTVFILNYCISRSWDPDFGRDLVGPSEIKVGDNFEFNTYNNEVVASGINDGGF